MEYLYHDITEVIDNKINLILPDYINTKKVEIIIFPFEIPKNLKNKVDYNKYFGVSDIGENLIDKHLKNIRNEWKRKILD